MPTITYAVPDLGREKDAAALSAKVRALPGVDGVDIRVQSEDVVVSGTDLDGGAIHDAIHEAGYGARRVIELAEPYLPRPVSAFGIWTSGDWRMKKYTIAYRRDDARPALVEAAEAAAADILPTPAITPTRYGVGFLGIHDGRGGNLVFVDWWENENDLHHHVFVAPERDPAALRQAQDSDLSACVWDLSVIGYEREAWLRHVFAAETPDLDAYLGDQVHGRI